MPNTEASDLRNDNAFLFKEKTCIQIKKDEWLSVLLLLHFSSDRTLLFLAAAAAADAAGCLVTVSMEPAPIVMVMGQGRETQ